MSHSHPIDRRKMLATLGLAPAAMAVGPNAAWALQNVVDMRVEGRTRIIQSNGIPDHQTGQFPNSRNPNRISEQMHEFRMPVEPTHNGWVTPLERGNFGVAVNGVPFDPFTAEFWQRDRNSGWRYEAVGGSADLGLDDYNAHVQPTGAYHYHGLPNGLIQQWSPHVHSPIIGYAADGFPIYALYGLPTGRAGVPIQAMRSSWQLKQGSRRSGSPPGAYDGTFVEDYEFVEGLGDLDQLNGIHTVTPDYPDGTYAYFLTETFPFIPRGFAGDPDSSFRHGPPGGQQGGGQHGGGNFGGGRPPPPNGGNFGGRPPPPGHRRRN